MQRDGLRANKLKHSFIKSLDTKEKEDLADKLGYAGYETSPSVGDLGSALGLFIKDKNLFGKQDKNSVWVELTNFGYRLGDRLLNLSTPHLYGSDVEELQELLSRLGFYSGTHTSIYSEDLEQSVEKFQENRGLTVDGNVGLDTVRELKSMQRPGERLSLNNAMNVIDSREIFLSKQNHTVCFFIPHIKDYKARSRIYEITRESSIKNNINPIFSSDINKEVNTKSVIKFTNQIQPSFFIVLKESSLSEVNYFKGKHSESTMGKVLAKNLADCFSLKLRGSSSDILSKTKPAAVVMNIKSNFFGNNYQKTDSDKMSTSILLSIEEINRGLL